MKVIFAQGNPGQGYEFTRHNIGFLVLDHYAEKNGISFSEKSKFKASIGEGTISGEKVLLVKPSTFYNETGLSARAIADFYKLEPEHDLLVIHDDLALPFGTIRTRDSGRDAGNNGIKSLNAHLGESYRRIRMGIHNDLATRLPNADFVLANFSPDEKNALPALIDQSIQFIDAFLENNFPLTKVTR